MMKQLCSMFLMVVLSCCAFGQNHQQVSVYFETAKHHLTDVSKSTLDEFSTNFPSLDDFAVEILAHTDSRGTDTYNKALANRRAIAVQDYLTTKGLHVQKVSVNSFGENNPKYTNTTEEGRRGNRRVDVIVKAKTFETVDDIISQLTREKNQTFTISTDKEEIIKGESGTIITVPVDAFEFKDGSGVPTGEVSLHLEEAYSFGDLIALNMPTVSDGQMLQTGGSLHITATSDGKDLKLKSDKSINIKMPSTDARKGMELFVGERNDAGEMNWMTTGESFNALGVGEKITNQSTSFRRQSLPVVLDENGTIDQNATRQFYNKTKNLEIPSDYVPFRYETGGEYYGYVPAPLGYEVEQHRENFPEVGIAKPIFKGKSPSKPTLSDVQYNPKGLERVRLGKKGIQERREEILQKKLISYERRLARYEADRKNYEERLSAYNKAYEVFKEEALADWDAKNDSLMAIVEEVIIVNEAYLKRALAVKSEEERIENLEAKFEETGQLEDYELYYYTQDISGLGYINCDKFPNIPLQQREPVVVKKDWEETSIMVVIPKYKSVLQGTVSGGYYKTPGIPKSAEVTILGFKTKNGQVYLGKLQTRANGQEAFELDYQPVTLSQLKEELSII